MMETGWNKDHESPYRTRSRSKRDLENPTTSAHTNCSSAKKRSVNASSTVCGVVPMFNMLSILKTTGEIINDSWASDINIEKYDLQALCVRHDVELGRSQEQSCKKLVDRLLKKGRTVTDEEVSLANFKKMHITVYSAWHKPDVAIYLKGLLILILEVHSCGKKASFANTIRKTILGLVDLLRYYSTFNQTVTSCKGLVVPKIGTAKCAIEVTVEFQNFGFYYTLQEIPMDKFSETLKSVFQYNLSKFEEVKLLTIDKFHFYIKLPMATMEKFGKDCEQVASKEAIMFRADDYYYKIPVVQTDCLKLSYYCLFAPAHSELDNFITLTSIPDISAFRYLKVPHNPLSMEEAKLCLGDFVIKTKQALKILHGAGLYHCDVRLENICFKEDYTLTFIDMDRSTPPNLLSDDCVYPDSCMYDVRLLRSGLMDWRQLSCIILWVITGGKKEGDEYHKQTLTGLEHAIAHNKFLLALWNEGK